MRKRRGRFAPTHFLTDRRLTDRRLEAGGWTTPAGAPYPDGGSLTGVHPERRRDGPCDAAATGPVRPEGGGGRQVPNPAPGRTTRPEEDEICLLYTSDAADDLLCVDLGGRR